jgi:fatty acid desaturase
MAVGAAIVVIGTLLPWVRTGGRRRNSYDVLELVERLGFAPDGAAATALRRWPVVTLLVVFAVVAMWWGWPRLGGASGLVAAAYAGTIAAVVTFRGSSLVHIETGAAVTIVGAVVLAAGSVAALADAVRSRSSARS